MFIIIYPDGRYVTRRDLDDAFSLPGINYIFSVGSKYLFKQEDGICYLNKDRKIDNLRINYLELINVGKKDYSTYPYLFSLYDHQTDKVIEKNTSTSNIENALRIVVITVVTASQFPSWEAFITVAELTRRNESLIQSLKQPQKNS